MSQPFASKVRAAAAAAVVIAAVSAGAFAASNGTPPSNAGQGADVVEGFTVTNISFDATPVGDEEFADVQAVFFEIARDGDNATTDVSGDNAEVYLQLRDGTVRSDWAKCAVGTGPAAGEVICDTSSVGTTMQVVSLDSLSIVAYDSNDDA
jgi:hypothetical protein